jgi:uncharacterized damage-inducible protein DinB
MEFFDLSVRPGANLELSVLAATLEDSTREWRESLEEPCQEAVIWQIYENGPSIGGLLLHLVSCEQYWFQSFVEKRPQSPEEPAFAYDRTMDQYVPHWPAPPDQPIGWYFDLLERQRKESLEMVRARVDPHERFQGPRYAASYRWILAHVVEHDSYTGGQAVLLHETWKKLHGGA